MESITHRIKLNRTGAGAGFFGLIFLILAIQFLELPPLPFAVRLVVAVVPGLVVLALFFGFLIEQFAPAVAFWPLRTMPADNFLRLGADGLTYVHRGRARNWRWSELAEITRRWRRIAVVVPDDERIGWLARWRGRLTGSGPHLTIWDDYVLPIDRLGAKLREQRAAAPAAKHPATEVEATQRADDPATLPALKFRQRRRVEVAGVRALVVVFSLPVFVFLLISYARNDSAGVALAGGLALLICLLLGVTAVTAGAERANCLSLDPKRLRYTRNGLSLVWPWHELSPFELRQTPPQPWHSQISGGQIIAFTARGDENVAATGREAWFRLAGSAAYAIPDGYDAGLTEIMARLNEYRERALAGPSRA